MGIYTKGKFSIGLFTDHLIEKSNGEFLCHFANEVLSSVFQPIFSYDQGVLEPIGSEALMRLSEGSKFKAPLDFLNRFENDERHFIDRLLRACHVLNFVAFSKPHQKLFLNVDPISYRNYKELEENCTFLVKNIFATGLNLSQIVFELVEKPAVSEPLLIEGLQRLKDFGISIAIDDYGAGSSNMERVMLVKPNIVKFDRSWLVRAQEQKSAQEEMYKQVQIMRDHDIDVLVEGVEFEADAKLVERLNPNYVQGFYWGRPKKLYNQS